ncbi:MAG: exodeoxyribonuclease VII large subunit [Chloroflexaceae bacterium]|nr:exodeoxyribonuclease VII large subunit [Chloroflexaceae bacterium]
MTVNIISISQITSYLRELLENDVMLSDIWVLGEVSNLKRASSGHYYFTLKDDAAALDVAMWRTYTSRLTHNLQNGDAVLAHGRVSIYEPSGRLQFYVDMLQPAGVGLLHARFEELKQRLAAEGLFDESRKRPLPPLPHRIGIATSAQAAALRDILTVLARRYPLVEVVLSPCLVQGERAPDSISAALYRLYAQDVDLIILARGGGSIEDLWCFNEEIVARTVFASPVPVITGVGHETDTTIVDYVADVRAATPSAAAEQAVPDMAVLAEAVTVLRQQLDEAMSAQLWMHQNALHSATATLQRQNPALWLARSRQQVDDLVQRATRQVRYLTERRQLQLDGLRQQLITLSPYATLHRGYAVVQRTSDGGVVTAPAQVQRGERLRLTLRAGELAAVAAPPAPIEEQHTDD